MSQDSLVIKAIKKALPSVVSIVGNRRVPRRKHESSQFWGLLEDRKTPFDVSLQLKKDGLKISSGSGFVVDKKGIILSNRHLISPLVSDYWAIFHNKEMLPAKVLTIDPINDLAFLKVEGENFPYLELGDSSKLELGQTIIAIGTALGEFEDSVSAGVVSGLSRFISAESLISGETSKLRGLIQTDAAINPGNSGGPLIDLSGKAIGVNTALVFGAENISFAIPISHAKKDLEDIKKYGKIRQPYLGVRYLMLSKELKERNNFSVDYGALVVSEDLPQDQAVIPNSPAERATIREFDIILECQGEKITAQNPLEEILRQCLPGQEIRLKILREQKELILKTKIEEK